MAKRRKGGHRAPTQYDPRRGKRQGASPHRPDTRSSAAGQQSERDSGSHGKEQAVRPVAPNAPRRREPSQPLEMRRTHPAETRGLSFADLGLGLNLVRTLGELGATEPFPVQAVTIPEIIEGYDVLGRARTGSGKTIAFGAGVVERMLRLKADGLFANDPKAPRHRQRGSRDPRAPRQARRPKVMILAPTRELALQIDATVQPLARAVGFYTAQLVGGIPVDPQVHALERGVDIVIGTPGRMLDLVERRKLDLREIAISVLDEADHMCDLGFLESTQELLRFTVHDGQRIFYSATLDGAVSQLVEEFQTAARAHEIADHDEAERTEHRVLTFARGQRDDVVVALLEAQRSANRQTLVFCRTRAGAAQVTEVLVAQGIHAVPLHGDLTQVRRERNLDLFATGKAAVLVATDVAARGLHISQVDLVLHVDPATDAKTYLHRSGRTGRAGAPGRVITLSTAGRLARTQAVLEEAGVRVTAVTDVSPENAAQHV